jgi:nucleotide-binding universal stress UspA family protein
MTGIDRHRPQRETLRSTASRYGVVNRYLGGTGYRPGDSRPPEPATTGLVALGADDTPAGYIAVDHAAIEAEVRGWDLRIVHVLRSSGRRPGHESGSRLPERLTDRVHAYSPSVVVTSRPIVAGVDHGDSPATSFAIDEARARGRDLVMWQAGWAAERTDRVEITGDVRVHHRNIPGDPASALITASATAAAPVVGRSGLIGVPGSLGSVSRAMVQRVHCPAFLVG